MTPLIFRLLELWIDTFVNPKNLNFLQLVSAMRHLRISRCSNGFVQDARRFSNSLTNQSEILRRIPC